MKRFFQPVPKDGGGVASPFKKPNLSAVATGPAAETTANSQESSDLSPSLCPNVVGGGGEVCAEEKGELKQSRLEEVEEEEKEMSKMPLKFLTWNCNSLLLRVKNNWPEFSDLVRSLDPDVICFQEVRMPAAGSKGGPKNPRELKDDTNSAREEKQVLMRALSSPPFKDYRVWWSLSDSKYAGTGILIKKQVQIKKIFFTLDRESSKHEQDGRVILAEFDSCFVLNTYSPNNGWKEEENSFKRRRKWDKRILDFVLQIEKPLIWCGDLNVSHQEIDVSHPEFFSSAKLNGYIPPNKEASSFFLETFKNYSSLEGKYQA